MRGVRINAERISYLKPRNVLKSDIGFSVKRLLLKEINLSFLIKLNMVDFLHRLFITL